MSKMLKERVLEHMDAGQTVMWLESASGWNRQSLIDLAGEHGFGVNAGNGRFQRVAVAKPKPVGIQRVAPGGLIDGGSVDVVAAEAQHVVPVPTIRPAHRDLIDEGKASSVAKVRRAAERVEAALQALADVLDETRAAEAERRAREAEKAKKAARIAELKAELARLTGKAPAAAVRTPKPSGASSPSKAIREWAQANGVDCPANGPVPRRVVEAYEDAIGGAA